MKIFQISKVVVGVALAALAVGVWAQTGQALGPMRGQVNTAKAVVAIDQSKIALKSEAPNLSNLCTVGDARCVTPVLTCAAGKVASGGSCVDASGITGGAGIPLCPGTQVRSGASCVEASTLIPSQSPSGTMCGLYITYGAVYFQRDGIYVNTGSVSSTGAYAGDVYNWNSGHQAPCKGVNVSYASSSYEYYPGLGNYDTDGILRGYLVDPGYYLIYRNTANCPTGYSYRVIASSDQSNSATCVAN